MQPRRCVNVLIISVRNLLIPSRKSKFPTQGMHILIEPKICWKIVVVVLCAHAPKTCPRRSFALVFVTAKIRTYTFNIIVKRKFTAVFLFLRDPSFVWLELQGSRVYLLLSKITLMHIFFNKSRAFITLQIAVVINTHTLFSLLFCNWCCNTWHLVLFASSLRELLKWISLPMLSGFCIHISIFTLSSGSGEYNYFICSRVGLVCSLIYSLNWLSARASIDRA
jgi:hypothetical protein